MSNRSSKRVKLVWQKSKWKKDEHVVVRANTCVDMKTTCRSKRGTNGEMNLRLLTSGKKRGWNESKRSENKLLLNRDGASGIRKNALKETG